MKKALHCPVKVLEVNVAVSSDLDPDMCSSLSWPERGKKSHRATKTPASSKMSCFFQVSLMQASVSDGLFSNMHIGHAPPSFVTSANDDRSGLT